MQIFPDPSFKRTCNPFDLFDGHFISISGGRIKKTNVDISKREIRKVNHAKNHNEILLETKRWGSVGWMSLK